jgi:hypothetical protein
VWDVEQVGPSLGAIAYSVTCGVLDEGEQRGVIVPAAAGVLEGREELVDQRGDR